MLNALIKFPIWKNDGKAVIPLNDLQKEQVRNFMKKVSKNDYTLVDNPCLCGNDDKDLDLLISEKDRYGIPQDILLCRKCGLIRTKKRLDDASTEAFYKNEYRDIYVGREEASDTFFQNQVKRGEGFFDLLSNNIDLGEVSNVFEVGCGAGGILYPFLKANKQASGCDFGEKYLEYGIGKGIDLYQGEVNEEKTPKESQDLVILSHVMEHFTDPLGSMSSVIEHVKSGKYLLVEVPGVYWIPKGYFNPILYFQNAHVHNYYYYYLYVLFSTLGLEVIYGDERCTFILRKPEQWKRKANVVVYSERLTEEAKNVERSLKLFYLKHKFRLNRYYYRIYLIRLLTALGLKEVVKSALRPWRGNAGMNGKI